MSFIRLDIEMPLHVDREIDTAAIGFLLLAKTIRSGIHFETNGPRCTKISRRY